MRKIKLKKQNTLSHDIPSFMLRLVFSLMIYVTVSFGKSFPDFTLKIHQQKGQFHLGEHLKKEKLIFLNFFASWCTPCIKEIPELEKLKNSLPKNFQFIAINEGETPAEIKKFILKTNFSFLILEDPEKLMADKLNLTSLPRTVILGKDNKVIYEGSKPPSLDFLKKI